jgi:hypothetical protein
MTDRLIGNWVYANVRDYISHGLAGENPAIVTMQELPRKSK